MQSVCSISSGDHWGVGQEVGTVDPVLEIKLEKEIIDEEESLCEVYTEVEINPPPYASVFSLFFSSFR